MVDGRVFRCEPFGCVAPGDICHSATDHVTRQANSAVNGFCLGGHCCPPTRQPTNHSTGTHTNPQPAAAGWRSSVQAAAFKVELSLWEQKSPCFCSSWCLVIFILVWHWPTEKHQQTKSTATNHSRVTQRFKAVYSSCLLFVLLYNCPAFLSFVWQLIPTQQFTYKH